jgi:hypothetical protein
VSDEQLPRFGLFMLAPLLAFVLIVANALSQINDANETLVSSAALNAFTNQIAETLDAFQSERADAAVVLRDVTPTGRQQYLQEWTGLDALIAEALNPAPGAEGLRLSPNAVAALENTVAGLGDLRTAVLEGEVTLEEGVSAYSAMITAFIEAFAEELERQSDVSPSFAEAFLFISTLQERVAVEVGTGLNAFYMGQIDPEAHQLFIEAIAPQDLLSAQFATLTGPAWQDRLSAIMAPVSDADLEAARSAIINGGYTADQRVDQTYRSWWRETRLPVYFALGELRNEYAAQGLMADIETARSQRRGAVRNAFLQILVLLLAAAASLYGLISFIEPRDQAARA